ncbi:class I SAM-dependent methyltransferase [bacterium 1xD8-6]|jgi:Methylase involved in ubiquinone/menaquinone biosynthesis|nr:class I SAM-dependent methyltransferase [bacterium D16-36]RKI72970.1 class I SAM-dependent methyltransferase [bacterium 1xD8-6]
MEREYDIYGGFASVYDLFMDNIPYDDWFRYVKMLLEKKGIDRGIVVELACGTGEMAERLCGAGYDVIGVDLSEEMLAAAREKCSDKVLLLHQDIRELDLYGSASAMVCVCDGMNYICTEEELQQVFGRAYTFLEKQGVLIFDMKTEYYYREVLGNRVLADNRENASYIWENMYDAKEKVNEYLLTVYALEDDEQDLFVRTDELHRQKAYDAETVCRCLREQGFGSVEVFGAFTEIEPDKDAERVYFIAQK